MTPEDRADYRRPGPPARYGSGGPLSEEDRDFLRGLQKKYWRESPPERTMLPRELHRAFGLVREHRLPTVVGAGVFGLSGYSMRIYDSPEPSMIMEKPEVLLHLVSDHIRAKSRRDQQRHWSLFTQFTHSPENLALLDYYGMPRPGDREEYDY